MYKFLSTIFANDVFSARLECGMTQRELSEKCGVDAAHICRIEGYKAENPTMGTLLSLCRALNLQPSDYIEYES